MTPDTDYIITCIQWLNWGKCTHEFHNLGTIKLVELELISSK